jgi:CRP-like cAMP-binding protein
LLAGEPRVATVRARVPTELLALNRTLFRGLIAESAETVQDLEQVVQQRLAGLKPG